MDKLERARDRVLLHLLQNDAVGSTIDIVETKVAYFKIDCLLNPWDSQQSVHAIFKPIQFFSQCNFSVNIAGVNINAIT